MEPGKVRYAGRIKYYDRRGNKVYVPAINLGLGHIHYLRRQYYRTATACEEYGKRVAKRYQSLASKVVREPIPKSVCQTLLEWLGRLLVRFTRREKCKVLQRYG
jgi:hypothetical protein